jgi:E3 ubiquitin-protein ligase BRE1
MKTSYRDYKLRYVYSVVSNDKKAKAEQKYFSTMKSKDQIHSENGALKQQLTKTAEVITKVQEAEKSLVQKLESQERQLSLTETIRAALEKKLAESVKRETDRRISLESSGTQITALKAQVSARIAGEEAERKRRNDAEEEKAMLSVQLEAARGTQSASISTTDNSDLDTYRRIARCGICNDRWKDTTIAICGHVFCKTCVDVSLHLMWLMIAIDRYTTKTMPSVWQVL